MLAERRQEGDHGLGVIAGLAHVAHPQRIGLQLLRARVALDGETGNRLADIQQRAVQPQKGGAEQADLRHLLGGDSFGRMTRGHMADLMRQHAGQFGLAARQRQQAAGDVDIAARQREGVDDGGVQQGEAVVELGEFAELRQAPADAVDIAGQPGVLVFAAEGLQHLRMLLSAQRGIVLGRQQAGETLPSSGRIDLATAAQAAQAGAADKAGQDLAAVRMWVTMAHDSAPQLVRP